MPARQMPSRRLRGRVRAYLLLVPQLLLLSGCVVGPDYMSPQTPVPDAWHQELQTGQFLSAEDTRQWWMIFDDPKLNELIYRAGEQNLDLYAAYNRICQARAQVDITRSPLSPFLDATGSYQRVKTASAPIVLLDFFTEQPQEGQPQEGQPREVNFPSVDLWGLGYDVSWEPDLFGRITRQIEAACGDYQSTVEAYRDLMVTLYAEVARNYVELRTLQQRLDYAHRNVTIQRHSLELATARVEGGVAPILDQHQAESNLSNTEAALPPLETGIHLALNRLAVLLGEYPRSLHCELLEPAPIPANPDVMPVALPCDVVRQRPDIRQAERLLAARTAEIGVAVSDLYPRFSLLGTFNLQARELSDLFGPDSWGFGVGPSFRWAILHAGQIQANIGAARCAAEESYAIYEQTVLLAAEEAENAIVAYNNEMVRQEALQRTVEASQKSLESVLELYRAGKTDFQNVLVTQNTLFITSDSLAVSDGQVIVNLVSFYKALGGGWDPRHHCPPRCVRLACPPDCPTEIPKTGDIIDADEAADDPASEDSEGEDSPNGTSNNAPEVIPNDLDGAAETSRRTDAQPASDNRRVPSPAPVESAPDVRPPRKLPQPTKPAAAFGIEGPFDSYGHWPKDQIQ